MEMLKSSNWLNWMLRCCETLDWTNTLQFAKDAGANVLVSITNSRAQLERKWREGACTEASSMIHISGTREMWEQLNQLKESKGRGNTRDEESHCSRGLQIYHTISEMR
jgi:hypothetical protein